jgi:hypothetical protein
MARVDGLMGTSRARIDVIRYNADDAARRARRLHDRRAGNGMIQRRRSRLHGWGVFAAVRIPRTTRITHYAGEKITHRESARREAAYMKRDRIWCFRLNTRWVIEAGDELTYGYRTERQKTVECQCRPGCGTRL